MANYDLGDIEIDPFDPASISNAIMRVNLITIGLNRALKELYKFMLDEGVTITRAELVKRSTWDADGGKVYNSIKSEDFVFDEKTGKGIGYITAGDGLKTGKDGKSVAVYLEFGTGVHAASKQTKATSWGPKITVGGKQIDKAPEPEPTKPQHFYSEETGRWHTIYGQPPKHFMSTAMIELWGKSQKKWAELLRTYLPHEE